MVVGGRELIDTLWNVNPRFLPEHQNHWFRINRYIMECKFSKADLADLRENGINRYIMECKYVCIFFITPNTFELIDTLWNVNANMLDKLMAMHKTN